MVLTSTTYFAKSYIFIQEALSHDAFIMSLRMPAPTPVQKASRNRMRQKYSAARTFFLTILIISAITILSVFKERLSQYDIIGAHHAHISRTHLTVRDGLHDGSSGELVRRDLAVRWTFLGLSSRKDVCDAYLPLHSADSSIPLKTSAPSSVPIAQTRNQVSFPTYNYTIASCTMLNLSPSLS